MALASRFFTPFLPSLRYVSRKAAMDGPLALHWRKQIQIPMTNGNQNNHDQAEVIKKNGYRLRS
jgi:hypothetical protein